MIKQKEKLTKIVSFFQSTKKFESFSPQVIFLTYSSVDANATYHFSSRNKGHNVHNTTQTATTKNLNLK